MSENNERPRKTWTMLKRAYKGIALNSLPIGTLVKDVNSTYLGAPIVWKIADINHDGYPDGAITLITEKTIALRCFDAKEPNNSHSGRATYGNNRYSVSNIRQWLNSDAEAGQWYIPQHSADAAPKGANVSQKQNIAINPYDTKAGFLNGFSKYFKDALLPTTLTVGLNTKTDGGGSETITDKIFLASNTEVGLANQNNIAEGSKLSIFSDDVSRKVSVTTRGLEESNNPYDPSEGESHSWWLRTPNSIHYSHACIVDSFGRWSSSNAYTGSYGARPLCNIPSSVRVSETPDENGVYTIVQFK